LISVTIRSINKTRQSKVVGQADVCIGNGNAKYGGHCCSQELVVIHVISIFSLVGKINLQQQQTRYNMNNNKLLTTAVAAIFGVSIANADISLTDNLTLSGFVDASYSNTDQTQTRSELLKLNQVEVDLAFGGESASAEVHLDNIDPTTLMGGDAIRLEQAFASYDLGNGLTVSGGRMLNLLGFESDEPTGTYQFSDAYSGSINNVGQQYNEGIRASFGVEDVAVGISAYSGGTAADFDLAYEAQVIFTGIENLTLAVGFSDDDTTGVDINEAVNVWASYESGQMTVAAEYSDVSKGTTEGDGYLLLANYTINDNASITVRYSEEDFGTYQSEKFTISPSYSFTDNLGALIEYSNGEATDALGAIVDVDVFAIETTFTF
jgi:hypothetical protein